MGDILRLLLAEKADPNTVNDGGNVALHFAAEMGRARCVHVLLEHGAHTEVRNGFGKLPASKALPDKWESPGVTEGKQYVQRLLNREQLSLESLPLNEVPRRIPARVCEGKAPGPVVGSSSVSSTGVRPCEVSSVRHREEPSEACGLCPVCVEPLQRHSPMWAGCSHRLHLECLAMLREWRPDAGCAVCRAPWPDSEQVDADLKVLLRTNGITVKPVPPDDSEPLLNYLVRDNNLKGIRAALAELWAKGGDQKVRDRVTDTEEGVHDTRVAQSPLHLAASLGRTDALELLLATRASPSVTDDTGNTPLHRAADLGRASVVLTLLTARADPAIRNNFGRTPRDLASKHFAESVEVKQGKVQCLQHLSREKL